MSDLVFFDDAYHLVYAHPKPLDDVQPSFVFELRHLWINFKSQIRSSAFDKYPRGAGYAVPAVATYPDGIVITLD